MTQERETRLNNLVKQPLVHFLILGLALFVVFDLTASNGVQTNEKTIVVDEAALLRFVQYRTKAFQPEVAQRRLAALEGQELDRFIADYVREEALHREALALGMDVDDYIIKRRLIQKVEFITSDFATTAVEVGDEELAEYYESNRDDYYVSPFVTFTHVFFDRERHGDDQLLELAHRELDVLNRDRVSFSQSMRHGDRFLYHTNYVERTPDFVASHFGAPMAEAVFSLPPSDETWHGPFESPYGVHLVMLTRNVAGRYPALDEITARVHDDARREAIHSRSEEAVQAIVETYDVQIAYKPESRREAD